MSADKARRPFASRASSIHALASAPLQRINSTSHRSRPMPGAGSVRDGAAVTRHRVVAALGSAPEARSASFRQRRIKKCRNARLLGRELKAARWCEPKASDFADDPSEPAMPKTLFDGRQDFGLAACLGIDDAIGMKADGGKRRGEEVTALQAPQHRTLSGGRGCRPRREQRMRYARSQRRLP